MNAAAASTQPNPVSGTQPLPVADDTAEWIETSEQIWEGRQAVSLPPRKTLAVPRHAMPRHATPRLALPRRATQGNCTSSLRRPGAGHREPPRRAHPARTAAARLAITWAVALVLGVMCVVVIRLPVSPVLSGYWIFGAVVILGCLTCNAAPRSWTHLPPAPGKVLALVPAYNEDQPNLDACIRSLLAQTIPPDRIVVVDDGSATPVVPWYHPRVEWIRQPNRGKRGAHCTALRSADRGEYEFVVTVDSDSRPHPDAVEHLLRAMSDPKIQAATGWLRISNYADSWVSRAADIDIGGSCVMMRASRSYLGALETTSGALAMYRAAVVYDHLDEYEVECGTGDDRWLAMRALLRGEVVAVNEAVVDTDMPSTLRGTYRQRIRWARSWLWMVPFCFARLKPRQIISPTYGLIQLAIAPVVLGWAVFAWSVGAAGRLAHPWTALGFIGAYLVVRYSLSALYLFGRPMPWRQKAISFIVGTPAAVLLNLGLLMPLRYWAIARLNDNRWQSRGLV